MLGGQTSSIRFLSSNAKREFYKFFLLEYVKVRMCLCQESALETLFVYGPQYTNAIIEGARAGLQRHIHKYVRS